MLFSLSFIIYPVLLATRNGYVGRDDFYRVIVAMIEWAQFVASFIADVTVLWLIIHRNEWRRPAKHFVRMAEELMAWLWYKWARWRQSFVYLVSKALIRLYAKIAIAITIMAIQCTGAILWATNEVAIPAMCAYWLVKCLFGQVLSMTDKPKYIPKSRRKSNIHGRAISNEQENCCRALSLV
jgi:hypothetical protein